MGNIALNSCWPLEADEIIASALVEDLSNESAVYLKELKENKPMAKIKKPLPFRPIAAASMTLLVVGLLLMSGPAYAFTVSDWSTSDATPNTSGTVTLTVKITKNANEVINTIVLTVQAPDGSETSAVKVSCAPDYPGGGYGYGYGYSYGYGSSPYGYGYGYGYGYSNDSSGAIICTYTYTPNSNGTYAGKLLVNGHLVDSNSAIFTASTPPAVPPAAPAFGGGIGGGGGRRGAAPAITPPAEVPSETPAPTPVVTTPTPPTPTPTPPAPTPPMVGEGAAVAPGAAAPVSPATGLFGLPVALSNIVAGVLVVLAIIFGGISFRSFYKKKLKK